MHYLLRYDGCVGSAIYIFQRFVMFLLLCLPVFPAILKILRVVSTSKFCHTHLHMFPIAISSSCSHSFTSSNQIISSILTCLFEKTAKKI